MFILPCLRVAIAVCLGLLISASARAVNDEETRVHALEKLLTGPSQSVDEGARKLLDPNNFDELSKAVRRIRKQVKKQKGVDVSLPSPLKGKMSFGLKNADVVVDFLFTKTKPHRITMLSAKVVDHPDDSSDPLTWETVASELKRAAEDGFAGAVLLTRQGQVFLNKGYGFANREKKIPVTKETVFAIGSAPIDFTHAGILLLKDREKLSLDDPITTYFETVPADKQVITIKHLMTGRSGLPDFHELPSDKNPDHSWIDRGEAIRRIMNQKLLFQPGSKRRHSHSAWGLLAAIIEIVSGQSYQQFTTENLFKPAGMVDTGFFGDSVPEDRIAVGYGVRSSTPNSPPHWGKTSWLVMGSGGQVSTLMDMYRWEVAMRDGAILAPESAKIYLASSNGVSQDGDSFGFEFMHSKDPEQLFMIISNSVDTRDDRRKFDRLGRRLYELIKH